jgi:hypothetical protein
VAFLPLIPLSPSALLESILETAGLREMLFSVDNEAATLKENMRSVGISFIVRVSLRNA